MTTKHTPGTWVCRGIGCVGTTHELIASVYPMEDERPEEHAANVRLIAAAPDLLEALQWYEAKAVQMGRAAIDQDSKLLLELMKEIAVEYGAQARAAIAKATGDKQ